MNLRYTIKQSEWSIRLDKIDRIFYKDSKLQIKKCKIIKNHFLSIVNGIINIKHCFMIIQK